MITDIYDFRTILIILITNIDRCKINNFRTKHKIKPLSAPNVYLTRASLYPWYFAGVYAPTLLLLHQLPLNPHLQKEGKRDIASMFKTEP